MRMLVLVVILGWCAAVCAADLLWPLPGHDYLTGGFADSRPEHFHGGIDLRTRGENLPVVAPTDGWIERLSVTPPGYGRTVYYRLADGRTAVFGHLSCFAPVLESMLRDSELTSGTYRVDCLFDSAAPARTFHRGDTLAFTGCTGSGPPHLHFEIREGTVQTDPLASYPRPDKIAPVISALSWIALSDYSPAQTGRPLALSKSKAPISLHSSGPVAFFVRTYDAGPWGRNAVPTVIRVKVDGVTVYEVYPTRVDLAGDRDIYSRLVWTAGKKRGADTRRLFDVPPPPDYFDPARDSGGWIANVNGADVRIEVEDRSGNKTERRLNVTAGPWPEASAKTRPAELRADGFLLPLKNDRAALWARMESLTAREVLIGPVGMAFGDRLRLSVCLRESERLPGTFFYQRTGKGGMRPLWPLPATSADSLACQILTSGIYGIGTDTEPPVLTLTVQQNKIRFRLTDGLSAVDDRTIRCTVDGHTAIAEFEYEERGGYIWTQQPLSRGSHEIVFTAGDRAGNLRIWNEIISIK
jgi:hypothetical protein